MYTRVVLNIPEQSLYHLHLQHVSLAWELNTVPQSADTPCYQRGNLFFKLIDADSFTWHLYGVHNQRAFNLQIQLNLRIENIGEAFYNDRNDPSNLIIFSK